MKLKFLTLSIIFIFLISCVYAERKQAKIYQNNLEMMLGKEKEAVFTMITDWNFEGSDFWEAENPDVDTINKHNRPVTGFSNDEIQEIFSSKGKYNVILFIKKVGTSSATTGKIDSLGRGILKDRGYAAEHFTLIRAVFRNDELVNYKVWPNVSSSRISGIKVKH